MTNGKSTYSAMQYFMAWCVHAFTASAAVFGLLTLFKIYQHNYIYALALMGLTVAIDAIDGTFARLVKVKEVLPWVDGALLDNIVDYLNYVITPCFFLLIKPNMLPSSIALWIIGAIILTSSYQFCQAEAKTPDHFFKGFPCYWNFAIFYMFIFNTSMTVNAIVLIFLCILIFVPIKYVYPSRIDYLFSSYRLKLMMHICSLLYATSLVFILINYPNKNALWLSISLGYIIMYLILSLYRTCIPHR